MTNIIQLPSEPRLIGPALRNLRLMVGMTQRDLVDAGVSTQGVISALENGHVMPMMPLVLAYLGALDCNLGVTFKSDNLCDCGRMTNKQGTWCCRMCREQYGSHSTLCRRRNAGRIPGYEPARIKVE
jgi:transcriptional regulator with XRE-family HTH domain